MKPIKRELQLKVSEGAFGADLQLRVEKQTHRGDYFYPKGVQPLTVSGVSLISCDFPFFLENLYVRGQQESLDDEIIAVPFDKAAIVQALVNQYNQLSNEWYAKELADWVNSQPNSQAVRAAGGEHDRQVRYLEYRIESCVTNHGMVRLYITRQSHRLDLFTPRGRTYTAKNGWRLESMSHPECLSAHRQLFVRGKSASSDNNWVVVPLSDLSAVIEAIEEYREAFSSITLSTLASRA